MKEVRGSWLLLGAIAASCGGGESTGDATPAETSGPLNRPWDETSGPMPIVLIVVDTLRRDHLSCYGYPRETSPQLDRLAADSVQFLRPVSQAPWTTPSIGALMTSQYPMRLGIEDTRSVIHEDEAMLAEVLQAEGYRTHAVISHTFCSEKWGFAQGFETFDESNIRGHHATVGEDVSSRAIEFLDEQPAGEPFFLWLHYFDPHFAYKEQSGFEFQQAPPYEGPVRSDMPFSQLRGLRRQLQPKDVAEIHRLYDSEIAYTDRAIGRVLERMRELGLYERSLIIFTGDHGEEFLEHGDIGHTKTVYEEVLAVPLLVKVPGMAASRVERPVALVDVFPTVLELLELEAPVPLVGQSLFEEPAEPASIFAQTGKKSKRIALREGRYKYIFDQQSKEGVLYDLETDPEELRDRAAHERERVRTMRRKVMTFVRDNEAARAARVDVDAATQQRLQEMGYQVDGDGAEPEEPENAEGRGMEPESDTEPVPPSAEAAGQAPDETVGRNQ